MSGLLKRLDRLRDPGKAGANAPAGHDHSGQIQREGPSSSPPGIEGAIQCVQERVLREYRDLLTGAREDPQRRRQLKTAVSKILLDENFVLQRLARETLAEAVVSEIVGFGPLDSLLGDPSVTEIMVNGPGVVFVERGGKLEKTDLAFRNDRHLEEIVSRIVAPLGRRIDQSTPYVDARLPDGSRVNVIMPPLSLKGATVTVRKFHGQPLTADDLVATGSLTPEMAEFLRLCVRSRFNLIVSGGTGSGKTTLLNVLCDFIDGETERIITIEDSAELRLPHEHVVSLESRPANIEGRGEVTIRQLLKNALRMRPDRIIIGEVRGGEAFDLLQAMNTGHDGSLGTVHANSPKDALRRLVNMALMAGEDLPYTVVREQVQSAVDVVVHLARLGDGSRKVTEIGIVNSEASEPGEDSVTPLYRFVVEGRGEDGKLRGHFVGDPAVRLPAPLAEKAARAGQTLLFALFQRGEAH